MNNNILQVKNLNTSFVNEKQKVKIIENLSFSLGRGETLGLVGESGCGKSVSALAIMRLLPKPSGIIDGGEIYFAQQNLLKLTPEEMRKIRGRKISMIFQEPMTALNPVHTIGKQLAECFSIHFPELSFSQIKNQSIELLDQVGIPLAEKRLEEYPHHLSGGIRQRIMIAMAISCKPEILIADEPTTALDVTIQAQILSLLKDLQKEYGMSIIFITHDLGVIAEICDNVVVMYSGRIMETASVNDIFYNSKHPYTKGLLCSIPRLDLPKKVKLSTIPGIVDDFRHVPVGCRFQNRCKYVQDICKKEEPKLFDVSDNQNSRCFFWDKLN